MTRCQAKPRSRYKDPGWECTGDNLVTVLWATPPDATSDRGQLPVVVPADHLDEVMAEPNAKAYAPRPFTGGDHLHLVLSRPTPPDQPSAAITPGGDGEV